MSKAASAAEWALIPKSIPMVSQAERRKRISLAKALTDAA
jgi:hypothetical protein